MYAGPIRLATQVLSFSFSVAVAASTLIAAALFSPLRRWVGSRVRSFLVVVVAGLPQPRS
jgi:hypothetical protein